MTALASAITSGPGAPPLQKSPEVDYAVRPSVEAPPPSTRKGWRLGGSLRGRSVDLLTPGNLWTDDLADRSSDEAGLLWRGDRGALVIGYHRWAMAPPAPVAVDLGLTTGTGGHHGVVGVSFTFRPH